MTTLPGWPGSLAARLERDVCLAPFTTLKIGGRADWYFRAESLDDLVSALNAARAEGIPVTLLGDGSNVLISDRGVRGLVIHNRAAAIERRGNRLWSESGALLATLVDRSRDEGLTGLEFAAGIYGSVGGAIFGNAGAYGKSMADVLDCVEVLTEDGERQRLTANALGFSYRASVCKSRGWVVLGCEVVLQPGDRQSIGAEIDRIVGVRATKLPTSLPSAGSYFKNIEDAAARYGKVAAGQLLEAVGAKAMRVGGAAVYERHANVIINRGNATAADVLALADRMRKAVFAKYGHQLESEVRFIGEPHV